jgi:hypothetical protein
MSLIVCQIQMPSFLNLHQHILALFTTLLLTKRQCFCLVMLIIGVLLWAFDITLSSFDICAHHVRYLVPPRQPVRKKICSYNRGSSARMRTAKHCRRLHHKRRGRHCRRQRAKLISRFDGWACYPMSMPSLTCTFQEQKIEEFIMMHDPSRIMEYNNVISPITIPDGQITLSPRIQALLFSSFDNPSCFSLKTIRSSLIIDSGTSVCVTPHKSDFISYKPSTMKIKDLSSLNHVKGKGIVKWLFRDTDGNPVDIEILGCHMPMAEVRLLSPQVLLQTIGGHSIQTTNGIDISLDNGINISATYCQQSNLPVIPLMHWQEMSCFWSNAFGFSMTNLAEINKIRSTLSDMNTSLSSSQKELLLWHQRLSHALISWVQLLMRDKSFLPCDNVCTAVLHKGPFIKAESHAPTCDTMSLKCAACLCAKAAVRLPENTMSRKSTKSKILKVDHLQPGDCISADHYISHIHGRVPTGFGKERIGYSCGCLFVDHASSKIFNFAQYSTTAKETSNSALQIEALAQKGGLNIKHYHSDNGVFSSNEFKTHCNARHIKYSFSGVGAKHQNGIAERNIKMAA